MCLVIEFARHAQSHLQLPSLVCDLSFQGRNGDDGNNTDDTGDVSDEDSHVTNSPVSWGNC